MNSVKKRRSLDLSVVEGSFASVMQSSFDQFLIPFAVALNSTSAQIGFVRAFPQLGSSLVQFFAPEVADGFASRKRVVSFGAVFQAVAIALLVFIALWFRSSSALIFAAVLVTFFSGFINPLWSSWMGDLTNENERGSYFSYRNKIIGISSFAAIISFGIVLNYFEGVGNVFFGFAVVFAVAMIARFVSFALLNGMHEPSQSGLKNYHISFKGFMATLHSTNFGRFVIFMSLMAFAMNIASPFFAVYVLEELGYSYIEYTVFTVVGTLVSFLFVTYWGAKADRLGNRIIFTTTAMVMPLLPLLWLMTKNFYVITLIQAFGNFAFIGFSLSSANFVYDAVPAERRTRFISYFNVLNGIAIFSGALLGGFLLSVIPSDLIFDSKFHQLFLVSSVFRVAVVLLFFRKIEEVRKEIDGIARSDEKRLFVKLVIADPMREVADNFMTNVSAAGQSLGRAGVEVASRVSVSRESLLTGTKRFGRRMGVATSTRKLVRGVKKINRFLRRT